MSSNLRLPWKTESSLNLLCGMYDFYYSGVLSNLRFPWKTELPWNFYCIEYTLCIQKFWETRACPEKQSCPEIFPCLELHFTFWIWATCACREKQRGSLNLLYRIYIFYYSGVLSNIRLPWKTELPWNFSLYWIYVIHSGVLSNLSLPWKTELPRNFSLYGVTRRPIDASTQQVYLLGFKELSFNILGTRK